MKKIYVGGSDSKQIYDVSSDDSTVSNLASTAIQTEFGEIAKQLNKLIRERTESKNLKSKT